MGTIEWLIVAAIVIYSGVGLAKWNNQPSPEAKAQAKAERKARREADKPAPTTGPDRPSLLVAAWNATGAQPLTATHTRSAVAELAGRAVGRSARWGKAKATVQAQRQDAAKAKAAQAAAKFGQVVVAAAQRRWETKTDRSPVWQRTAKKDPAAADDETSAPDAVPNAKPGPDEPVTATVACRSCGKEHTITIPPGQVGEGTTCPCGAELLISRRPLDLPTDDTESQPGSTDTENKEQTMTIPAQRAAQPTANSASAQLAAAAPAEWAATASRVADFHPESDADLINFMTGEVAGICGYSESFEVLHQICLNAIGLDPTAVQGLGEFAEHAMELTERMTAAHQRFVTTYQEVIQAVANGVVLPYNGRWMTGEGV